MIKSVRYFIAALITVILLLPFLTKAQPSDSTIKETVMKIIAAATKDSSSWERLAEMCDTYGNRLSGSDNLERALNWVEVKMKEDGLKNVTREEVMVPHWVRGTEHCELIHPRYEKIEMLTLGGSVATPPQGITAEVMTVKSFDELKQRAAEAKGKIILYNEPYKGYGHNVQYRWGGALEAAKVGAVGSIIRSVTPLAASNPHTGSMAAYPDSLPKVPNIAIVPEAADLLERMEKRGQHPKVHIFTDCKTLPDRKSANVMSELPGTDKKDEIIAVGGHSDSWDVGSGAHDDGGGVIAAWEAVKLLKNLGIKLKRTVRAVAWVNEENGQMGGKTYAKLHKDEKHALVLEFDSGVFPPSGIGFSAKDSTLFDRVKTFEPYLKMVDSIEVRKGGGGVDISPMMNNNDVPGIGLNTNDHGKYFWYHHSPADTPDKVDPADLNKCVAAIAVTIYLYSELMP